jgi:hypothetical protein
LPLRGSAALVGAAARIGWGGHTSFAKRAWRRCCRSGRPSSLIAGGGAATAVSGGGLALELAGQRLDRERDDLGIEDEPHVLVWIRRPLADHDLANSVQ